MTESEYIEIERILKKKYVGKFIYNKEDDNFDKIVDVYVDFRKDAQHMNRVVTEYGNVHFLTELSKEAFVID